MKTLTTLFLTTILALTVGCSMTGPARADDSYFSQAELDSMLAPVALYPDSVLSHVLIAATYPLEVIQAARFSREHPGLRGEDAVVAVDGYDWDPSVKALVAFPDLLRRMDEDLDWTQDLGDAFLVQEEDVIASIQYLRSEAYSQGHLRSNDRVKVVREKEYIYIEPARTRLVYVPYYDPRIVYSSWRWSSHPPRYWHRPSGFNVSIGFHWGRPYTIRPDFYFSSFHWAQRQVVVVNHHHHYYRDHGFRSGRDVALFRDARHWRHDPVHRRGVSYRGRVEKTRFVDNSRPASAATRSASAAQRTAVRSDRREWAAERRSSVKFDRNDQARSRAASRSDRVAELRGSDRGNQRSQVESRDRGSSRSQAQSAQRASAGDQRERSRSVTDSAPERASSRSRSSDSAARSSGNRAGRVSESLRSGASSSRESAYGRSRGVERSSSRSSSSKSGARSNRSERSRSSVEVPRGLTVRSSNARERSSAPSRSSRSSASSSSRGAVTSRASAPSRQSAPSRSRSSGRDSAPSRSTPRVQSAPSRSSESSSPSRSARLSAPSRSSGVSSRSSRSSAPSRSRGGDSRRGGGEERR
ncbi:MAG: DUF3300 domain-containing protein [Xanthomonadales bacterium]|nr:DUF3300 domain-containing protein [Xanthomonadales bacterium]